LARLQIDTTISSALNRTDAAWKTYLRSLEKHGGDEFIAIAIEGDRPFHPAVLEAVTDLTRELETLPDIRRVDSLATVPLIRADGNGGISLDAALAEGVPEDERDRQALTDAIRKDRLAPRSLVSRDERAFALNVLLNEDVDGDRLRTVWMVRDAAAPYEAMMSGVPIFREAVGSQTMTDLRLFLPLTIVAIIVVVTLLFGAAQPVVVALAVGVAAISVCLGAMGFLGVTVTVTTMVLPPILLALGCAYAMHLLTEAQGVTDEAGIVDAAVRVGLPVLLSGVTTSIGFLAMATVRIVLIRDLAVFGAIGVLAATFAAITLAPALLVFLPIRKTRGWVDGWVRNALRGSLVRLAEERRRAVLIAWVFVFAVVIGGVSRLEISSDVIRWFPHGSEVRDSYEEIRERLSGITPVNVLIEAKGDEGVSTPEVIGTIDALARSLEELPQVGKAVSVADPLRQMRRVYLESDDAGLPTSAEEIEQYLLLLEGVDQLSDVITSDRRGSNILLRVDNNSSIEIVALGDWVEEWWSRRGLAEYSIATTGIMYEFGRAQEEIAYGLLRGLSVALLAIGAILFVAFRETHASLLALIPNTVPIVIAFGFMGVVGTPVDSATVCFGSLALGIAVDDTIHVMAGFRDGLERGWSPGRALDECFRRILPALVFTTVAIVIGFSMLSLSGYTLIRNLGVLTAGVVALCLVADLTLLPALILGRRRSRSGG
jgi:predicted RND superfamily exporter protein